MLDISQPGQLEHYLRESGHVTADERLTIRELRGGVSSVVMHVARSGGPDWVVKQSLAKLRVAVDWFSDPVRIAREAQAMQRLAELTPPGSITRLVSFDPAARVLAMEAVPQPHENWKTMLLAGRIDERQFGDWGELLAAIHLGGWRRRAELVSEFADASFFESLRIEPYYEYTAAQLPHSGDFLRALVDETRRTRWTLVHGDYSPKNVLLHEGRMVLLDHEVAHWGDGAFDVGFSLAHLLAKYVHLPSSRPALISATRVYWQTYWERDWPEDMAGALPGRCVRHALGCLLARVAGRSKLEYLSEQERNAITEWATARLTGIPASPLDLLAELPKIEAAGRN